MRTALIMVQVTVKDDAKRDVDIKRDVEGALLHSPLPSAYGVAAVVKVELDGEVQL